MIKWLLGALLLLAPSLALAQNQGQIVPSGRFTTGHTVRCQNSTCTVAVDGGGSAGSSTNGQGYLTEIGITNTGTPFCINDALINAVGGYHQFCVGANSLGGGLISYNAIGGASPLDLLVNINGSTHSLSASGGNVTGPVSSTIGNIAIFNSTLGTIIKDTGNLVPNITVTDGSTAQPSVSQQLQVTHAGPGAGSYLGNKDYLRVSVGNYPTTSEFAGDPTGTVGSLQGIVGAVVQPTNAAVQPAAYFGVAGYSACSATVGNGPGGSCTGVSGNGVALASASVSTTANAIGINGVTTNAPQVSNPTTQTGFDYVNLTGAEIDANLMKLAGGAAPHANVVGISIVGVSETAPSSGGTDCNGGPCLNEAILINPLGLNTVLPWKDGIRFQAGSTTNALSIGAICQATLQCSSQAISMEAYTAAGAGNLVKANITLGGGTGGFLVINAPGQVGLQVNGVNLLNATSTSIAISQPMIGGTLPGSQLVLHSTTNGAPSGDQIVTQSSLFNVTSADGLTAFLGITSALADFTVPIRFPASTTGAVTPAFTNAPTGCSNVVWIGPLKTAAPAQSNVYLAACHT